MESNKIGQQTIEMLNEHERKYENLRNKWLEFFHCYENKERQGSITEKTESKTRLSQGFSVVEQSVARALARAPRFQYLARKNDKYEDTQAYQDFISYQWDLNNADSVVEEIYRWAVITGISGWKVGWRKKSTIVKEDVIKGVEELNPLNKNFLNVTKDTNEVESVWTLQAIKPFDLMWNVEATCADDATMLAHRDTLKLKDIEAYGFNINKIKTMILSNDSYWDNQLDAYNNDRTTRTDAMEAMEFSVYECYVTQTEGTKSYEKVVFVVGGEGINGGKVVLDIQDNPFNKQFKAIGVFRPTKVPGKMQGLGLLEPVLGVLYAEEDTFNMTMEALWTDISKPMEYVPGNVLNEDGIEYGARKLIPVKRLGESVNVLPTPDPNIGGSSFALNFLERNKQNITAITDYQTGSDALSRQQTATEVEIKTMQSDQRSTKIHKTMEIELLTPLGKRVLALNKQYLADESNIKFAVTGKKGSMRSGEIKFKVIDSIEDVTIVRGSTSAVIRDQEYAKWSNFWNLAVEAQAQGVQVDLQEIMRSMIEEGIDVASPEMYLPSLKEQEKEDVSGKMSQLNAAKEENVNPFTARVAETDNHKVHMQLHEAALNSGGIATKEYTPEEIQALTTHLNDHVRMGGGVVPSHQEAAEAGAAQGVQAMASPTLQKEDVNPEKQPTI